MSEVVDVLDKGAKHKGCKPKPQRVVLPESEVDLAYLAGIIDGEGSIYLWTNHDRVRTGLCVVNTDDGLIEWLSTIGGTVTTRKRKKTQAPCHQWNVYSARDVQAVLIAVMPYLRIKRDKAREVLSLVSQNISNWEEVWGDPES